MPRNWMAPVVASGLIFADVNRAEDRNVPKAGCIIPSAMSCPWSLSKLRARWAHQYPTWQNTWTVNMDGRGARNALHIESVIYMKTMLEAKCWYFRTFSKSNLLQFQYSYNLSRIRLQPQKQKAPTSQSSLSYFSIAASRIQQWILWGCCWQVLSVDGWMDGWSKDHTLVARMTIGDRLLQSITSFNCSSKRQVTLPCSSELLPTHDLQTMLKSWAWPWPERLECAAHGQSAPTSAKMSTTKIWAYYIILYFLYIYAFKKRSTEIKKHFTVDTWHHLIR